METNELYDWLNENCYGKKNGKSRREISAWVGVPERRLRKMTQDINTSSEFERLISATSAVFVCETKEECEKMIKSTYRAAISLFKKAKAMEKKVGLNGQIKMSLGKDTKDFIETFVSEE